MSYLISDIENIILLDNVGLLEPLLKKCKKLYVSNIMFDRYSINFQRRMDAIISKGVEVSEVDIEFYKFQGTNKFYLNGLGDASSSLIYHALNEDLTLISNDHILNSRAKNFNIRIVELKDVFESYIDDVNHLEKFQMFSNLKKVI